MSASALLKSVLASPDDDLPRLVYADWLDEHGDPDRAEFIRTQIELANLPDYDPRFRALEDREHELLNEHEQGWLGVTAVGLHEWEWRRGFVDEIATNCVRLCEPISGFTAEHPVTQVRCIGMGSVNPSYPADWIRADWSNVVKSLSVGGVHNAYDGLITFFTSGTLPRLRDLDFTSDRGGTDVCRVLWGWPGKKSLRSIRFGRRTNSWFGGFPTLAFTDLVKHSPLEHLTAFDAEIDTEALATLLSAPFAGTLKHLDISDNPIAPDAYRGFRQCHPNMRLDKLDVSGTPLAGISLEPLLNAASLQNLTKLEMNGCGSARRNMEVLSRSAFWNQATELRAHSGTIPASTLEPLCQTAGPPGLRLLDLADNYLRTEGVRLLCDSPWTGSLTWLALSRNYLDDESCEVLAKSGRFTHLRTLHLAHNNVRQEGADSEQITTRGVISLAEASSLANLRLLTLSYTGITDAAVDVAVNAPFWRLFGLGVGGCDLSPAAVRMLANSPRLNRFTWLDISHNPRLRGQALRPLAESPYLSRMCELDCGGIDIADDVRAIFRERLGPRFSH